MDKRERKRLRKCFDGENVMLEEIFEFFNTFHLANDVFVYFFDFYYSTCL